MKITAFLAALLLLPTLAAHPDPSHTLEHLEEHLAETPDDQALLRQKAGLLITTGHPDEARAVVSRLLELGADQPENLLVEARLLRGRKDPGGTVAKARSLVAGHPKFAAGWKFLAESEDAVGRRDEAITAMRRFLDISAKPGPTEVLTCAAWLEERGAPGDAEAAVSVLDLGLAKIGCLTGLQHKAIGIELELGRHDSALRRIDALTARFRPSVALSLRRADILEKAGRFQEAVAACDSALALLDALPASRKNRPAYREQSDAVTKRKAENMAKPGI